MSALFSYINWATTENTTITVGDDGDAAPGIPGSGANLLVPQRSRRWVGPRAPIDATTNDIEFAFTTNSEVRLVALFDLDLTGLTSSSAFVLDYKDSVDVWQNNFVNAGQILDGSTVDAQYPHIVHVFDNPTTVKAIRLRWNTNASTNDTVSASRLFVGRAIDVGNFFKGYKETITASDDSIISAGRNQYADLCNRIIKNPTIVLEPDTTTMWGRDGVTAPSETLHQMFISRGKSRELVFLPAYGDKTERRRSIIYGAIQGEVKVTGFNPPGRVAIQMKEF